MVSLIGRSRLIAAFAAVCIIWGSTYLAVALALRTIPPFLLTGTRSLAAGVILLGLERFCSPGLALPRTWLSAAVGGVLLFVGCHGTLAYAQQRVPSGVAAVLLATIPFWILLLNFLVPAHRRPKVRTLVGLVPGLAGVAVIAWHGGSRETTAIEPTMVLLLVVSAFFWAAGSLFSQRHGASTRAVASSGMQLVCGGVVLLIVSAFAGELDNFSPGDITAASWGSLAYLTVAGSIVAFSAYVWLLAHAPGPLVTTYTFISPIIAVVLGSALLDERLSTQVVIGTALVIGSVVAVWRVDAPLSYRMRKPVADSATNGDHSLR